MPTALGAAAILLILHFVMDSTIVFDLFSTLYDNAVLGCSSCLLIHYIAVIGPN